MYVHTSLHLTIHDILRGLGFRGVGVQGLGFRILPLTGFLGSLPLGLEASTCEGSLSSSVGYKRMLTGFGELRTKVSGNEKRTASESTIKSWQICLPTQVIADNSTKYLCPSHVGMATSLNPKPLDPQPGDVLALLCGSTCQTPGLSIFSLACFCVEHGHSYCLVKPNHHVR